MKTIQIIMTSINKTKNINDIVDTVKMLMTAKCIMMHNTSSKCFANCGCDGSCSMFKGTINLIKNSIK